MKNGIVVGADVTQEWLLPWWWEHYRRHNNYPVAFIDFGMSSQMKDWCKDRGQHIPLRIADFAAERDQIDPALVDEWEDNFGTQCWDCRNVWFKKPLACLKSPFEKTVWIDLDCEIRKPLKPLFRRQGLAMARDQAVEPYPVYNSGVIVFDQGSLPLIKEWAKRCVERHSLFRGDQEVFSHMIAERGVEIYELPLRYNWSRCREISPDTVIHHWHGNIGKFIIRNLLWREEPS